MAPRSARPVALLLLPALLAAGCITRPVKRSVFDDGYTKILLRAEKRGTSTIAKNFDHPVSIAPVRLAHILSRIDLRGQEDKERVPAIPLDTLFTIAEGMSKALEEADPDEEVVVQSIRRGKSLMIFERQFLTSLLAYMKSDLLYIHVSRSDWEIPKRRRERLPETHVGEYPLEFHLVVDTGMSLVDHQSVAVQWRDDIFKRPTRTRVTPGGRVVRRTVLMESMVDETDVGPTVSGELTPEQLRALADLEEERRSGAISEGEYSARRSRILQGDAP